jgi:hypothetical protein
VSRLRATIALLLAAGLCLAAPTAALAAFGLEEVDLQATEEGGAPTTLAGDHPFELKTTIRFDTKFREGLISPDGAVKDVEVYLPPGFAGIPAATPRCSGADFATLDENAEPQPRPECADETAIGYVAIGAHFNPVPFGGVEYGGAVLYNLEPVPGTVAKFGFVYLKVPVTIEVTLSPSPPYRVLATVKHAPQPLLFYGSEVTVWGHPAADAHDPYRGSCFGGIELDGTLVSQGLCPVKEGTPDTALLTAPRSCEGPLQSLFRALPWEPGGQWVSDTASTQGFEDCAALAFKPSIAAASSAATAESPTGLSFDASFAENEGISDPGKRADSDLRRIVAILPEGVTLNPSAGEGLAGCTTAQLAAETLNSPPGAGCPQASKIGTVTATTPLVEESLSGAIFAAMPDDRRTAAPGTENPFDSFLAIYLVLRNSDLGVVVKQAGKVEANPVTGQVTATFDDAPQLPISTITTRFREGPRAPLATPPRCGTFTATALEDSWAGGQVTTTASFQVVSGPGGTPCPTGQGALAPGFASGTAANAAGSYAPLYTHITRRDGEADITSVSLDLPEGLSGKLAGVARCGEAEIAAAIAKTGREELAAPSCPAGSRVGSVLAGAGLGSVLTYVAGTIYLAGPYLGAPLSVVIDTPAVSGPFDLGNVVVRVPLRIDPATAEVTADGSASPLPRILKGIPLRLRDLRIAIDRPEFTLNPTSCEPAQITGAFTGAGPALDLDASLATALGARYQASNCRSLAFKPKLSLRLRGATGRTGHPALRAVLSARPGDANIARTAVILSPAQFIDNAHISSPCTRVQFNAGACPRASILGRVRAFSPLLDNPLEGPVYFRSNGGERELPDIVLDLHGEVHITQVGFVSSVRRRGSEIGRLKTLFADVPDVPLSKVVINLKGGKEGLLENSANLCAGRQISHAKMRAQNNRVRTLRQPIKVSCKKKTRKRARGHNRNR